MKALKAYSIIFLICLLGAAFVSENEAFVYFAEAEVGEEREGLSDSEFGNPNFSGGISIKSGDGGNQSLSCLAQEVNLEASYYRVAKKLSNVRVPTLFLRRVPAYIFFCNLKILSC